MRYDDASWHYGGDFPPDLPSSAGSTHIAMFVAWAVLHGLASNHRLAERGRDLARLRARTEGPVAWFQAACDEQFTNDALSEQGNAFARTYYGSDGALNTGAGGFLDDYARCLPDLPTLYHAPADWSTYDRVAPVLSRRLRIWRRSRWLLRLLGR